MRTAFEFTLEGRDWWKPFLPVWLAYLLYFVVNQAMGFRQETANVGPAYFFVLLLSMLVLLVVVSIFYILILRIVASKLRIGDKGFGFRGDPGKFTGMVLLGTFLSIITVGIYLPWFMRKVVAYLASETSFGGDTPSFNGKPGKLFVNLLLSFWLPFAVLMAVVCLTVGVGAFAGGASASSFADPAGTSMLTTLVTFFLVLVVFLAIYGPCMYLLFRWYIDFTCAGASLRWKTGFWPSCLFILGQVCLTLVTLGIYWPAAFLKLDRHFARLTVIERDGVELGRLGFEGAIGKGFGLIWGQTLLCIVTLGIYIPWGYARIGRWIMENSYFEAATA